VIGFALQVRTDGTGGEIANVANFTELPLESEGGFTIVAWIRSEVAADGTPLLAPLLPEGEWFHLALAHNNYDGTSELWINGALADAAFEGDISQWLAEAVSLGFEGISWDGTIADIRIFDFPLSQVEVEGVFLEAEDFVLDVLAANPETAGSAAVSALRALLGDASSVIARNEETKQLSPRGGILRDGAVCVNPSSLFQILTPMEK